MTKRINGSSNKRILKTENPEVTERGRQLLRELSSHFVCCKEGPRRPKGIFGQQFRSYTLCLELKRCSDKSERIFTRFPQ